jgi:hypothetical protein
MRAVVGNNVDGTRWKTRRKRRQQNEGFCYSVEKAESSTLTIARGGNLADASERRAEKGRDGERRTVRREERKQFTLPRYGEER